MEKSIGSNLSSGAQKVERTAAEQARAEAQAAERAAADARYEAAKARADKKTSEQTTGRVAKAARREMQRTERAAEREARRAREKREKLARRQQREQARTARAEKKRSGDGGRRAPGIGGWIAAVSVLGAACLALATVVTVGAFRMNDMTARSANGYRATLYELVSVAEDMDDNFSKLRVSAGRGEQRALLTEILVDAALMESAIERFPVDALTTADLSSFVNHTGMSARSMLRTLSAGGTLSEHEHSRIDALCKRNAALCAELNDLALHTPAKELNAFFEGGEGNVRERFSELGAQERESIGDAPFAGEGNVEENMLAGAREIGSARAEEIVRESFRAYHVSDVKMTGETAARDVRAYNFTVTDETGTSYFVQVTKNGGKLVFFDSDAGCAQKNFSLENCDALAQEFLASLGYTGLTPVWFSDASNVASITYVADIGGVRAYPDMIRVRVCEEKGRVIGMDAHAYVVNHHGTRGTAPALSEEAARGRLSALLNVRESHLALIPLGRREVLAYEFFCAAGEEEYLVYLDAATGEELRIFRVHESAQGSYLR